MMKVKVILTFVSAAIFLVNCSTASVCTNCEQCEYKFNELEQFVLESSQGSPCAQIKRQNPAVVSGEFTVEDAYENGEMVTIFCHFGTLPGCGDGAWQRIVTFDRQGNDTSCPPDFVEFEQGGKKSCSNNGVGCVKVEFPVRGQSYTSVCGQVQGYGFGTGDSFRRFPPGDPNDINTPYLDGVSITYGLPYKHLWSYAVSQILILSTDFICPCTGLSTAVPTVPPFVGENYYCEGRGGVGVNNPLWDGEGCSSEEQAGCCSFPNQPWFHRVIPRAKETIQLRLCSDQGLGDERFAVFQYEFYIQ